MPITSQNPLAKRILGVFKKLAFRYTPFGKANYPYLLEPLQLATLVQSYDALEGVPGCFLEVGVARGMTTRFLLQHITSKTIAPRKYYALDTFTSFVDADIDYEVETRKKDKGQLAEFSYNSLKAWSDQFREFPFVVPIQSDCSTFDYTKIGPIAMCLLDVDLYLPTKKALPMIYDNMSEGGLIFVDDVMNNCVYDGAWQAYFEFCKERNIEPIMVGNKCGMIRKPRR